MQNAVHRTKWGWVSNDLQAEGPLFSFEKFNLFLDRSMSRTLFVSLQGHLADEYKPDRPHYSKKIRNKYIFIAGRVVSHAGSIILRVMKSTYERGLKILREGWQFPATMAAQMTLAPSG